MTTKSNAPVARHVNEVESITAWQLFKEQIDEKAINFDSLSDGTKAICLAILASGDFVASMVAASHHDTNGTRSDAEIH